MIRWNQPEMTNQKKPLLKKDIKEISINLYDVVLLFLVFVVIGFVLYDLYFK